MAKLLTTLKFGEWLPDLPEKDNPGSPMISNALWVNGAYVPAKDFGSLGASLPARCQGAFPAIDVNGDTHLYAATGTNIYEYNGSSFTSRAGGLTMAAGQFAKYAEFSSPGFPALLVATDFADAPLCMEVGDAAFVTLASIATQGAPPKASAVAAVNQFLMFGNTEETINGNVPNRVQWCGIADPTNWSFGTLAAQEAQAGEQFLNAIYGPVTHIADGYAYGLILQRSAITRAYYVGGDAIFAFDTYEKQRGAYYPNSPVQLGNAVYFIAEDGFCMTDGQQVMQIGHGKVDETFLSDVSQQYSDRVHGSYDPVTKLIRWCYCSSGNSTGTPDKTISYNYAEQRFMPSTQDISIVFTGRSPGYTMETLDNVSTDLDLIPVSLDDPVWQGGNEQVQAFDGGNSFGTLSGNPLDAVLDTMEYAPNCGGITYLDGARPVMTAPASGAASPAVQFLTKNLENEEYTTSASAPQNAATGICNIRAAARYVRARVTIPGGVNGGFGVATGIDLYGTEAGQR